ncbi:hypothetical protein F5148DRAFT_472190 [Russula earlei]|uniref:Uncharacterized protein n=1 Tax=Russula earlei TaxID=71964 RepID=A0ACC0UIM0_9AGAM|nr:hypothetical protein F5148DRAFT_472190 [Russula earlei]
MLYSASLLASLHHSLFRSQSGPTSSNPDASPKLTFLLLHRRPSRNVKLPELPKERLVSEDSHNPYDDKGRLRTIGTSGPPGQLEQPQEPGTIPTGTGDAVLEQKKLPRPPTPPDKVGRWSSLTGDPGRAWNRIKEPWSDPKPWVQLPAITYRPSFPHPQGIQLRPDLLPPPPKVNFFHRTLAHSDGDSGTASTTRRSGRQPGGRGANHYRGSVPRGSHRD